MTSRLVYPIESQKTRARDRPLGSRRPALYRLRHLAHDLACRLVGTQTEIDRVTHLPAFGPFGELHLGHELRLHPDGVRRVRHFRWVFRREVVAVARIERRVTRRRHGDGAKAVPLRLEYPAGSSNGLAVSVVNMGRRSGFTINQTRPMRTPRNRISHAPRVTMQHTPYAIRDKLRRR